MMKSSIMCIRGSLSIKHEREKHNVQVSVSYSEAQCNIMWLIRGESHIEFRTQCVIMTLGVGGGGLSLMSFREIIEFQGSYIAMNCQWIVFLYTKSAQFVSCYSQYIQVNSSNQVIVQNYVKSADML